jgi:hypothetical protein
MVKYRCYISELFLFNNVGWIWNIVCCKKKFQVSGFKFKVSGFRNRVVRSFHLVQDVSHSNPDRAVSFGTQWKTSSESRNTDCKEAQAFRF